jgi:serine/threonine protein kinase
VTPERWRQIEDIFHAARERVPADRDAFFTAACGDDAALRAEVESLLNQHDSGLLDDGVAAAAAALGRPEPVNREGQVLGPYVLGPLLGAGGMGDVYQARDGRLARDVAVKILPDTLGKHPDRLARFEREARILASLNHPHIAALYGLEESNGQRALVLELVDGITLKQRLDSGAMPVAESIATARQIAHALEAAHHKGVVHRDLKPANVKITPQGIVKVLDFGLAKIASSELAEPGSLSVLATGEGVILGTVAYMSPEQARGLGVDKRTDIWAFGCVLYEMLTGSRPFRGETAADVLGAITTAQPDWTLLPPDTPPSVRNILRRCLTKDAERRLHDIADARIELDDTVDEHAVAAVDSPARRAGPGTLLPWMVAALMATVAAAAIWWAMSANRTDSQPPTRVSIALPSSVALDNIGRGSSVAISPDGRHIVYVVAGAGRTQLHIRPLGGAEGVPLAGTGGGSNPFFSPDGLWIGFISARTNGSIKKVPLGGSAIVTVLDGPAQGFAVQGAWWEEGGTILFASGNPKARGLWRISDAGGKPQRITTPREGELLHSWPQGLPGGNGVLYTIWNNTGFDGGRIAVQSSESEEPVIVMERAGYGRVIATGGGRAHLIYARPEGLFAAPFDLDRLRVIGGAVPVIESVATNLSGGAHFAVSSGGLLAYIPGKLDEIDKTLLWVARDGTAVEAATIPGVGFQYRLSPDGRRLAWPNAGGPTRDLWVGELAARRTPMRLTIGEDTNVPIWTPDGRRVIYSSGVGKRSLYWREADGGGQAELLTTSAYSQVAGSVSPDGATLAYVDDDPATGSDIWLRPLRGAGKPRLFVSTPLGEINPMISPDGRWLAYQSNVSGRFEIYVASLVRGGRGMAVSKGGGNSPLWSRDGRELYFRDIDPSQGGNMMVVTVEGAGAEPALGMPRVLFPSPYQGEGDIAPDDRFLLLKRTPEESSARAIELVLNWFEDLRARVPPG